MDSKGSSAPAIRLDKQALTETQLRTTEIMLYQIADIIDRIMLGGVPYTKLEIPAGGQ